MNNLQSTLITDKPNTSIYLVDIKCNACNTTTRAADLVIGTDKICNEYIGNPTFNCSGCNTLQPYTVNDIDRANRAGRMDVHIIKTFPTTTNKYMLTDLWINTHTNKMLFVQDSVRTFSNVQNTLYIPLAHELDLIELRYQLDYELKNNSNVPAVVQRILKQWGAIHPFMLTTDEIEQPGALFDVLQLKVEKSLPKLTARRTFIGPKRQRKAYFLDSDNFNLLTDPNVFNKNIAITCKSICKMIFHGGKSLHLFVVDQASDSWLEGKYIEANWDKETNTCTPLAIYNERPSFIV